MSDENLPEKVRGLAQAAEIVGGTLIAFGYILTHPDEVAPEGGWKQDEVMDTTEIRGRLRLGSVVGKGINLVRRGISRLGSNPSEPYITSVRKSSRS